MWKTPLGSFWMDCSMFALASPGSSAASCSVVIGITRKFKDRVLVAAVDGRAQDRREARGELPDLSAEEQRPVQHRARQLSSQLTSMHLSRKPSSAATNAAFASGHSPFM